MRSKGIKSILQNHRLSNEGLWIRIYILVTVGIFLIRVVWFAAHYGGIEHDSGWYLGVAKNLAHRGIYASYSNTIVTEGVDVYPSIHGRFDVQDKDGFVYFPSGVTVGPGYVLPQSILLRVFGDGWWQYRLWPLATYTGLLFLLFYITWVLGGLWSLFLFQVWLWAVPQLTTIFAYESFSEHTALFYLLLSFLIYYKGSKAEKEYLHMLAAGFFLSLSILTKLLFALTILAFVPMIIWDIYSKPKQLRTLSLRWTVFAIGFIIPIGMFEIYRYFSLVSRFGIEGWEAINNAFWLTFSHSGSGVNNLGNLDWSFAGKKLRLWSEVGIQPFWLPWICFLLSPLFVLKYTRKEAWSLILIIYSGAMVSLLWFVLISPTGWGRHAWHGLVSAMILVSVVFGTTLRDRMREFRKENVLIVLLILSILGFSIQTYNIEMRPFLNQATIDKWLITRNGAKGFTQGFPHAPVFSLADQREAIDFFVRTIQKDDRIYYLGWFLVAEMSPLVDKVFYPLDRYINNNRVNPEGGSSYLIFGPYQQCSWRVVPEWYLGSAISQLCRNIVFANQSYTICKLKEDLG